MNGRVPVADATGTRGIRAVNYRLSCHESDGKPFGPPNAP